MINSNKTLSSAEIAMRALSIVQMFFQNEEITQGQRKKLVELIRQAKTTSDFSEVRKEFRKLKFASIVSEHVDDFLAIFN